MPIIVAITELTAAIKKVFPNASNNVADLSDVNICLYDFPEETVSYEAVFLSDFGYYPNGNEAPHSFC